MQKGKGSTASPPAVVLTGRPTQPAPRGVPTSQPRQEEFSQRPGQGYQNVPGLPQAMVITPGSFHGQLQTQGQPRLPNQQSFYQGRPMRIPRGPPPTTPMYSSPPGGHMIPMIPPAGPFIHQQQNPQFIPPAVEFGQIPMAGPPPVQYRPQQPMPSQFPPVSGPSQTQGHFGYPGQPIYPMAQQSPPVYFVRPTPPQMSGIQPYQQQNFQDQPRIREKKLIQIKDPNSNKDVTQEILAGGHSSGTSSSAGGTPSNTPDLSGHSSSSSTPPLITQQQASVRAQFAAQVAATLANDTEHKSSSPASKPGDVMIQKPTVKPVVDNAKVNEVMVLKKDDVLKEAKLSGSNDVDIERQNQNPEMQSVEPVSESKNDLTEEKVEQDVTVSGPTALQSENNVAENSTADTHVTDKKASTTIVHVSELLQEAEPSSLTNKDTLTDEEEATAPLENVQEMSSEVLLEREEKLLNGPVNLSKEEEQEQVVKEETVAETGSNVESQVVTDVTDEAAVEDASEPVEQCVTEPQTVIEESEKVEVSATAPETEDGSSVKSIKSHEPESKSAAATKNPVDPRATGKDIMKKKKQKQRFKDMEKRSLEKDADMMDAYKEKPVKEVEPDDTDRCTAEVAEQKVVVGEEEPGEVQSEEETWEEKEDNRLQLEAENESGQSEGSKLTYERDFLLKFQYTPVCTLKPAGLPDLEVVLGTARPPPKAGYQGSRLQGSGGGDMFLPVFIRPPQKGNQQNPSRGRTRMPPKKVITLSTPPTIDLKRSENRWVRPSELSKTKDEELQKTEDLFRKVRSILNKLTPQKFQTLTQQIMDLDIDTTERLEGVIELIFEKAIDEPGFSVAYANMCRCLISKKVVVEKDGKESSVTFRKILLNRCQKEFEKEKSDEKKIHQKLEELSTQGLAEEEIVQRKEELYEEERKGKRRTLGNIRFIGELFKLKMLTENIMHDCVVKLLKSNDEESFECLCKLLVTIGKDLDHEKAKPRVDQYFTQINKIIQARITSSRVRFMMQDIMDLRNNNWVPRREDNNPKTIDQIHKEAADEAKKTQIQIQQASQQKRQRGNVSGRDSPRPQSTAPADDTWTTVSRGGGPRVSVDPKKFQNVKQRPVDSENISLGPGGRGYGAWAKGSSGGSGMAGTGAGPSVSAGSSASAGEGDSRPSGNRYSPLAGERRGPAFVRQNSASAGRQEPRSPVLSGSRKGLASASEREKLLETVKATISSAQSNQSKRASQERSGGRESPRLTVEAGPAAAVAVAASRTPSGPPSGATSPSMELTEEETKKKTLVNMDEYLNCLDVKDAIDCVKDLRSPSTHHVFVSTAFNHVLEKHSSERMATSKLIRALLKDGVLTSEQYFKGLEEVFEFAEDFEIDIPHIWKYLGELLSASAFDGVFHLESLHQLISKFLSKKRNEAKLFAAMFQMAGELTSPEDIRAVWRRSGLTFYDFFESKEEAEEFCKDKGIEFALVTPGSSQPARLHSTTIQEELRNLILKRKARNEKVFDWIDENVQASVTNSAPFVRALVTAVCEGTLEQEQDGSCKCNSESLKCKKAILQKYIDCNPVLELQALYAVQALFVHLDYPSGFMKSYFDCLYDEEIITEDSYYAWEKSEDPQEKNGKGVARTASNEFFRWLRNAPEESGEDN